MERYAIMAACAQPRSDVGRRLQGGVGNRDLDDAVPARPHDPASLVRHDGDEPAANELGIPNVAHSAPHGGPRRLRGVLGEGAIMS